MPRVNNRAYYDHDDRASGSSNVIRKVSFMNGSGRVKKNKKAEKSIIRYIQDDDVDMTGSSHKPWNKQRKNFKNRPGSPGVRGRKQQLPPLPVSDWYQVRIAYGSKYEKNFLLQLLLREISPRIFIPISYAISGYDVVFYIDDIESANLLRHCYKRVKLPDGHMLQIRVRESVPPPVPVDENVKSKIKVVMAGRYNADMKSLDLSKFASDNFVKGEFYCPLARPAIMRVVWQIISENLPDIVSVNLSNNKITVLEDSLSLEMKKLKNLQMIHLGDNSIKSLHALNCLKELNLTELVLKKNPLLKFFKDHTHYVRNPLSINTEQTNIVNGGVIVDSIILPPVISFDVGEEAKLPTPQTTFMCNPEGREIVRAFLQQYFAIYDSDNRLNLAQAYHDDSLFSLCAYYPHSQKSKAARLNNYIQESRNLFRVNDYPRRKSKLHIGKQNIIKVLSGLPKTQHDLSSFVVDLPLFTPALINLSVNGVFREPTPTAPANTWCIRHFSRTFLIVPVGQGFCIINDMLFVSNATDLEVQCFFKEESQEPAVVNSPSSVPTSPVQPPQLDDNIRLQMVQTLATQTGMNLEWSKKCLDETLWDFDRAIWTFNELQSKGSVPPEAFVK